MDSLIILLVVLFLGALICGVVLPIVAIVQTRNARREFRERIARLEAIVSAPGESTSGARVAQQAEPPPPAVEKQTVAPVETPTPVLPVPERPAVAFPRATGQTEHLESVIGRRWLGWAAVVLILFALAFFLKYAFDNRWIGELGRVTIGIAAGAGFSIAGLHYHRRGWRVFSQILAAGGIMLLYLSAYGAFGFYHLIDQKAAFPFLAVLVAEAAALAYFYNAPAIAMMALVGGFLAPILLRTDRDQYRALFSYLSALDFGAMALLKHWHGLSSLAYAGTQFLFWLWYDANYHPQKRTAVMVFQSAVFLIFFGAHLARQLIARHIASIEDLGLLFANPFVFFATSYHLLDHDHHDWMGVFAIVLALVYAGAARVMLSRRPDSRVQLLLTIATALTFVTLAVPIQLRSNWITIAWAVEALLMVWVGFEVRTEKLRRLGVVVLGMSLFKMVFWDTPLQGRPLFSPVFNRYFLSSLAVVLGVFGASWLCQKFRGRGSKDRTGFVIAMVGIVALWFVLTVETHTYFQSHRSAVREPEAARHLWWLGRMAVSVLWSAYAAVLATIGFVRRVAEIRWVALVLFAVTILKVVFLDMAELDQFYRITAFLVLGVILLAVAWRYQKAFLAKEPSK